MGNTRRSRKIFFRLYWNCCSFSATPRPPPLTEPTTKALCQTPPSLCASTALPKHADPSDRRFSDRSFTLLLMGTALWKHGHPSDRCFPGFQRRLRKWGGGGGGGLPLCSAIPDRPDIRGGGLQGAGGGGGYDMLCPPRTRRGLGLHFPGGPPPNWLKMTECEACRRRRGRDAKGQKPRS